VRRATERRVDDERDVVLLDAVNDVRATFVNFENRLDFDAGFAQTFRRAEGSD
jgi:hypothetical protein